MHALLLEQYLSKLHCWVLNAIDAEGQPHNKRRYYQLLLPTLLVFLTKRYRSEDLKHIDHQIYHWSYALSGGGEVAIDEATAEKFWAKVDRCYLYQPRDFPPEHLLKPRFARWCVGTLNPALSPAEVLTHNVIGTRALELLELRQLKEVIVDQARFLMKVKASLEQGDLLTLASRAVELLVEQQNLLIPGLPQGLRLNDANGLIELYIDELYPFLQPHMRRLLVIHLCRRLELPIPAL